MKTFKQIILKGLAKAADKAVEEACGSKCIGVTYEPEMPEKLKNKINRK